MSAEVCDRCGRTTACRWSKYPIDTTTDYIAIGHGGYGCDTGCCGLEAVLVRPDARGGGRIEFDFMHDQVAFVAEVKMKHPDVEVRVFCWECYEHDDKECAP